MNNPNIRGGEGNTLFEVYGDRRAAEKARLRQLHPEMTERQLTAATWDILPPFLLHGGEEKPYVVGAAGDAYRFDTRDTEGRQPTREEAEQEVEAFHEQEVEARLRHIQEEHATRLRISEENPRL